jgi:phage FluMu protein Com
LIRVSCATCGEVFEIGEEFAGLTEFCPVCGALNDIPNPEEDAETGAGPQAAEAAHAVAGAEAELSGAEVLPSIARALPSSAEALTSIAAALPVAPARERGIPSGLWWTLMIGAIGGFIVACIFLFSDNWESRHVQDLSEAANRGDALMVDEDYTQAVAEYRWVIQTVGQRQIVSGFIRQVVDRARTGELEAEARLRAAAIPATAPATQPAITAHEAIVAFQRDSEAFPRFVRSRPAAFQDGSGNWRRRQFVVWEVTYQQQPQSDPPQISLRYSCASAFTQPHDQLKQAYDDETFVNDESPQVVHIQTLFEWSGDHWTVLRHEVESPSDTKPGLQPRPSLDDLFDLERRAFGAVNRSY